MLLHSSGKWLNIFLFVCFTVPNNYLPNRHTSISKLHIKQIFKWENEIFRMYTMKKHQ